MLMKSVYAPMGRSSVLVVDNCLSKSLRSTRSWLTPINWDGWNELVRSHSANENDERDLEDAKASCQLKRIAVFLS